MSHLPERKEKDCLNCGAIVQGRYCQECGQENVVPKETFWHMATHFFYDITHFDSKFFYSIYHLLFKPGFLSKEYILGRRTRYLHPVPMYMFTSAIFFLLFFSLLKPETLHSTLDDPMTKKARVEFINTVEEKLKAEPGKDEYLKQLDLLKDTTRNVTMNDLLLLSEGNFIHLGGSREYRSIAQYDSMEKALPDSARDGWFKRRIIKKVIEINNKYRGNANEALDKFTGSLLHNLPYLLFVSLPLFALILRLVYIRRKQFYFADHGVFTIHLYVFTFLVLLAVFGINSLYDLTHWGIFNWLIAALFISLFVYLYLAMRKFYGQGRGKTFLKFLLVVFLSLIMMFILLLLFIFFSAFTL